jgi:hypothetical protein
VSARPLDFDLQGGIREGLNKVRKDEIKYIQGSWYSQSAALLYGNYNSLNFGNATRLNFLNLLSW